MDNTSHSLIRSLWSDLVAVLSAVPFSMLSSWDDLPLGKEISA